jgi:hypothetical protein
MVHTERVDGNGQALLACLRFAGMTQGAADTSPVGLKELARQPQQPPRKPLSPKTKRTYIRI